MPVAPLDTNRFTATDSTGETQVFDDVREVLELHFQPFLFQLEQ